MLTKIALEESEEFDPTEFSAADPQDLSILVKFTKNIAQTLATTEEALHRMKNGTPESVTGIKGLDEAVANLHQSLYMCKKLITRNLQYGS
jgi:hypothetical protein